MLFLLPASPMLLVLRAIYEGDAENEALPPVQRLARRMRVILAGVATGIACLAVEVALAAAPVFWLRSLGALRSFPWLFVALVVYLEDLAVLFFVGKVPLGYNLRNLSLRWPTTLMTALAFSLLVGMVTTLLAFVNGMDRLTENSGQPGNVIVLAGGANDEVYSSLSARDVDEVELLDGVLRESDVDGRPRGKDEVDRRLCSREAYIVVNQPIAPDEGKATTQQARGTLKSIAPDREEFVLVDDRAEALRLRMADGGKVFTNRTPARFEQLRLGYKVWVAFDELEGELRASDVRAASRYRYTQVRGIDDGPLSAQVHGLSLLEGAWFSGAGVQDLAPEKGAHSQAREQAVEAVLGEGIARELARDYRRERLGVGDVFELGPRKWVVVGITQSAGSTFGSEIWAKRSVVGPMFGKFPNYSTMVLRTKDDVGAATLANYLNKDFKRVALNAQPESEYYAMLSATNRQFGVAIYFVTVIMAVGGVFGVMNTMFAAISQRIKDIGVLRVVGYPRWQILVSFLLESMIIGLLGGALGAIAAYVLFDGMTATSIVSNGEGAGKTVVLKLRVTAGTLAPGELLTVMVGRIGGLMPALAAMRLKPLDCFR